MNYYRPAGERGAANFGWLDTRYTFSFANYYDPKHMGFGALRVINDDRIAGGGGFPPHGHRDMEIVTVVLSGALAHKDSMGNGSTIRPGDVQRMSAGTGVRHSEFNASNTEPVHLLQIWIQPGEEGIEPGYEQKQFLREEKLNQLRLIASSDGGDGSVVIHQDARIYQGVLEASTELQHELTEPRLVWVHVIDGRLSVGGQPMQAGDGLGLDSPANLSFRADTEAEVLVFELDRREEH